MSRKKMQSFAELIIHRYRFQSSLNTHHRRYCSGFSVAELQRFGYRMQLIGSNNGLWRKLDTNYRVKNEKDKGRAAIPPPPTPWFNFPHWVKWLLGSMLSLLLPLFKPKWDKLKRIEEEAELVVEEVEKVAEVVEKVAIVAEKVSAEVAEKLPDHGKLKEAALMVEHISQVTAHEVQLTNNFFHKIDALRQDLDELEAMIEPVVDKIVEEVSERK